MIYHYFVDSTSVSTSATPGSAGSGPITGVLGAVISVFIFFTIILLLIIIVLILRRKSQQQHDGDKSELKNTHCTVYSYSP